MQTYCYKVRSVFNFPMRQPAAVKVKRFRLVHIFNIMQLLLVLQQ